MGNFKMDYSRKDVPLVDDKQSVKDCKKQTPDYAQGNPKKGRTQVGYRIKDVVYVNGKSLINGNKVEGEYVFDSYDSYDNTCYVIKHSVTYNVLPSDLSLV